MEVNPARFKEQHSAAAAEVHLDTLQDAVVAEREVRRNSPHRWRAEEDDRAEPLSSEKSNKFFCGGADGGARSSSSADVYTGWKDGENFSTSRDDRFVADRRDIVEEFSDERARIQENAGEDPPQPSSDGACSSGMQRGHPPMLDASLESLTAFLNSRPENTARPASENTPPAFPRPPLLPVRRLSSVDAPARGSSKARGDEDEVVIESVELEQSAGGSGLSPFAAKSLEQEPGASSPSRFEASDSSQPVLPRDRDKTSEKPAHFVEVREEESESVDPLHRISADHIQAALRGVQRAISESLVESIQQTPAVVDKLWTTTSAPAVAAFSSTTPSNEQCGVSSVHPPKQCSLLDCQSGDTSTAEGATQKQPQRGEPRHNGSCPVVEDAVVVIEESTSSPASSEGEVLVRIPVGISDAWRSAASTPQNTRYQAPPAWGAWAPSQPGPVLEGPPSKTAPSSSKTVEESPLGVFPPSERKLYRSSLFAGPPANKLSDSMLTLSVDSWMSPAPALQASFSNRQLSSAASSGLVNTVEQIPTPNRVRRQRARSVSPSLGDRVEEEQRLEEVLGGPAAAGGGGASSLYTEQLVRIDTIECCSQDECPNPEQGINSLVASAKREVRALLYDDAPEGEQIVGETGDEQTGGDERQETGGEEHSNAGRDIGLGEVVAALQFAPNVFTSDEVFPQARSKPRENGSKRTLAEQQVGPAAQSDAENRSDRRSPGTTNVRNASPSQQSESSSLRAVRSLSTARTECVCILPALPPVGLPASMLVPPAVDVVVPRPGDGLLTDSLNDRILREALGIYESNDNGLLHSLRLGPAEGSGSASRVEHGKPPPNSTEVEPPAARGIVSNDANDVYRTYLIYRQQQHDIRAIIAEYFRPGDRNVLETRS